MEGLISQLNGNNFNKKKQETMCVVSFIGQHYTDKWKDFDLLKKFPQGPIQIQPSTTIVQLPPEVTREEFEALRKEVKEMVELLKKAKIYDEVNNEPDCEVDEKMEKLRAVAKIFDIDLDEVLKKK